MKILEAQKAPPPNPANLAPPNLAIHAPLDIWHVALLDDSLISPIMFRQSERAYVRHIVIYLHKEKC